MGGQSPTMIDESFDTAAPDAVARAGVQVVMMYLSPDPAKNATAAKVRAYHAHGVGVLLGWESYASRAAEGAAAGDADAREAVRQLHELERGVGYSGGPVAITFAVDFAPTPAQHDAIRAYFAAVRKVLDAEGLRTGVYGNDVAVDLCHAAGLTSTEWQTYAWSGGRLSPNADAYQWLNGQRLGGAVVDFGSVIHAAELGVWWAPGDERNGAGLVAISDADAAKIARAVWAHTYKVDGRVERRADYMLGHAWDDGATTRHHVGELGRKLDTVAQILGAAKSGVSDRVAAVQSALAALAAKVTTPSATPAPEVKVDTAAIVEGVAAKVKALAWKAQ